MEGVYLKKNTRSFSEWLYKPEPVWKQNLRNCDKRLFEEIEMSLEELVVLLEKLDTYRIFEDHRTHSRMKF